MSLLNGMPICSDPTAKLNAQLKSNARLSQFNVEILQKINQLATIKVTAVCQAYIKGDDTAFFHW